MRVIGGVGWGTVGVIMNTRQFYRDNTCIN